ncbi:hypothetical protein JOF57_005064 [Mycolicibacterium lutetiense]|uniref:Uncharacterized protein n=1 Tax=Mycolicibacterium lutetiense TaxID=1641992 RepID=A0ABS5A080_9MYCO|nr:hypothetical protein [Mycolicibacterium lutetiense]
MLAMVFSFSYWDPNSRIYQNPYVVGLPATNPSYIKLLH